MPSTAPLELSHCSLPDFTSPFTPAEEQTLTARMREWDASDFAGYRRILRAGSDCHPDLAALEELAERHRRNAAGKPIRDFVVLGIGGSSLGAEAILAALPPGNTGPRFHFADNADAAWFSRLLASLSPSETLFFVAAKSGGTPETISQFLVAMRWIRECVTGGDSWKAHFVLCTDPRKGDLREAARRLSLSCVDVPPAVGGRFSVLTPIGLFPAAFAGLRPGEFLRGARAVAAWEARPWSDNPCARYARALTKEAGRYPISVIMPYTTRLSAFSRWFCQLWGESLGKEGKGLTPYPALGATDQHSQMQLYMEGPRDKTVSFLRVRDPGDPLALRVPPELQGLAAFDLLDGKSIGRLLDAEYRGTRDAFTAAGIPNASLELERLDEASLGALFYFFEWATAMAGALLGVNPFDQPGVEASKVLTKRYLQES